VPRSVQQRQWNALAYDAEHAVSFSANGILEEAPQGAFSFLNRSSRCAVQFGLAGGRNTSISSGS
jgi:hypothetical protein